jgi:hypothetical protein
VPVGDRPADQGGGLEGGAHRADALHAHELSRGSLDPATIAAAIGGAAVDRFGIARGGKHDGVTDRGGPVSAEPDPRPEDEPTPGVPPHQPPLDGEDEDEVADEGAEESFPSSDPPATGGPGL